MKEHIKMFLYGGAIEVCSECFNSLGCNVNWEGAEEAGHSINPGMPEPVA